MTVFDQLTASQKLMTDAELLPILQSLTVTALPNAEVKTYLRENGMVLKDAETGGYYGKIINASFPQALKDGVNSLITAIYDEGVDIRTQDAEVSGIVSTQVLLQLNALIAAGAITQEEADGFLALGGGRPRADWVEATVAAERTLYNQEIASDSLRLVDQAAYAGVEAERNRPVMNKTDLEAAYRTAADYIRDNG